MSAEYPALEHKAQLRRLFFTCFQEEEAFLDLFFREAYDPRHCRCVVKEGRVASALYWFDCVWEGRKCAYLYAVGTDPDFRNRGLCRYLLEDTHALLKAEGYAGAILVPDGAALQKMYGRLDYRNIDCMDTLSCTASPEASELWKCTAEEYAHARRRMLPAGGVLQEDRGLRLLSSMYRLYRGEDFLLAAWLSGDCLEGAELLGNAAAAPGILAALGVREGRFRVPGSGAFAMYYPLEPDFAPDYFGLAFD